MSNQPIPTLDQTVTALRQILWAFAASTDRIYGTTLNPGPGWALVGVPSNVSGTPTLAFIEDPARIDISGFTITAVMTALHQYAAEGRWYADNNWCDLVTDTQMFLDGLVHFHLLNESGIEWEDALAICLRITEVSSARSRLDDDQYLTFAEVALLANMDEKSVRNAANPKGKDPLKTVNEGSRTYVEPKEALAWLSRRRGFKPTTVIHDKDVVSPIGVGSFPTAASFAKFVRERRLQLAFTPQQLVEQMAMPVLDMNRLQALETGDLSQDLPSLYQLALALNIQPEEFVRAFVELSLKSIPVQLPPM